MQKLSDWERRGGVKFLKKAGIKEGFRVLDFGCNIGNYSIPAALLVGEKGKVFAVDKDEYDLEILRGKAEGLGFSNLEALKTNGELHFDLPEKSFDFVMCYDVLHYLVPAERKSLYREIFRLLKPKAIFSVYPKHTVGNFALMELRNVTVETLIEEITENGFEYSAKICGTLSHDNFSEDGCLINFRKGK